MKKVIGFACLGLFLLATKCAPKYTGFGVFNETDKNIMAFPPDEFDKTHGEIGLYAQENDGCLISPYEMKETFIADYQYNYIKEWKGSKGFVFYFIKEENFKKTFEEIKAKKLYDSLWVSEEQYHLNETGNCIFKYEDKAVFTSQWDGSVKKEVIEVFGIEFER